MRKKPTPELLEQMLHEYSIRQSIAKIDLGVPYPLRTADGKNPFAIAKANPERAVSFVIDAPQPLHGTAVWKPSAPHTVHSTRLQISDFWLEPEFPLTTLSGQGAPEDEDRSDLPPDYETSPDVDPPELGGEFHVRLDGQDSELLSLKIASPNSDQPAFAAIHQDARVDSYDLLTHEKLVDQNSAIEGKVRKKPDGNQGNRKRISSETNAKAEEPPSDISGSRQSESVQDAIADFYAKNYDHLCILISSYLGRDIGHDALQDTMVFILSRFDSIPTLPYAITAYQNGNSRWLFNLILQRSNYRKFDALRKKSNQFVPSIDATIPGQDDEASLASNLEGDEPTPLENLLKKEDVMLFDQAFAQLQENYRSAITLYDFEGLSYEQCAKTLGIPEGTFKTWLHRARLDLFKRLKTKLD